MNKINEVNNQLRIGSHIIATKIGQAMPEISQEGVIILL